MKFRQRMRLAFAGLLAVIPLAGCTTHDYGWAVPYNAGQQKIDVVMPANAPSITQEFLPDSANHSHPGIDIVAKPGTPVIAAADGQVANSFFEPMYGNRVVIDHGVDATGKRTITVYKHLSNRIVKNGDAVSRGQQIGAIGRTGVLSGGILHLHFEVHREVKPLGILEADPHLFWKNGVGLVTCFDPSAEPDATVFGATYPVPCGAS